VHYKFASFSYAKACCFTHAGVSGENSPDRLSGESPRQSAIGPPARNVVGEKL